MKKKIDTGERKKEIRMMGIKKRAGKKKKGEENEDTGEKK